MVKQMLPYPTKFRICSGAAEAKQELVAFDKALIAAGISNYNLLRVSSILPIGCQQAETVDKLEGSALLVAYGSRSSNVPGETISSAVGIGLPAEEGRVGVIMEFSGVCGAAVAEESVRQMVGAAMENHGIACREILTSSTEAVVPSDGYVSVISAVAMW